MTPTAAFSRRLLVVDDSHAIHEDFRKILLAAEPESEMEEAENLLFGNVPAPRRFFEIDSAYQGQDGLALLERSLQEGRSYSMAFVDVRMPPGWDGIETITHLWKADPDLQVVICTAYSDYSWRDIVGHLEKSHNFVILKKPFDNIEVLQLAHALCAKRDAMDAAAARLREVEAEIRQRKQTERELLAALEAAEESNRCKRSFLATMSHELRTPLNAIIGYSEMLMEDARQLPASSLVSSLGKVREAARHLLNVINNILDMSRIESGRMPIQLRPVAAAELAREAIALASPLALQNRNRLELKLEDQNIQMAVDELRFRQSLLNLIGNACKFTSDGVITVEVGREMADGGEWILWRIRDTGIGIPEDQLPGLFRPFTQADSTANRRYGGSGLGLAISQKLCESMGGSITVESRLGAGSVFTIRLPAERTSADVEQDPAVESLRALCDVEPDRFTTAPASRQRE